MISLPGLFLALAGTALVTALVALFRSVHAAFGGASELLLETSRDLPGHAQLVEEKTSLLRAIKDLEYERAVGKIGDVDFQRLDAAYRARAKQVLAQLDVDTQPLHEEAERLIAEHRKRREEASPAEQTARPKKRKGKVSEKRDAVGDSEPPSAEHELAPAATAPESSGPSLDDVLIMIREGTITAAPEAPAHWPADARKLWDTTLGRALEDAKASTKEDKKEQEAPAAKGDEGDAP